MATTLTVLADSKPGTFSNIVAELRRQGFQFRGQAIQKLDQSRSRFTFKLGQGNLQPGRMARQLAHMTSVLEVAEETDAAEGSSLGDCGLERQLEALSITLARSYPEIVEPVLRLSALLPKNLRYGALQDLGTRVGEKIRKGRFSYLSEVMSLHGNLEKIAAPALAPFAEARVRNAVLEISDCPFCPEGPLCPEGKAESSCCSFLGGFLTGLLTSTQFTDLEIVELTCRRKGAEHCSFAFRRKR